MVGENLGAGLAPIYGSCPAIFVSRKLRVLLVFRTTFAYDTIVHRLNRKIDVVKAWQGYQRERAKEARKRVKDGFKRRRRGPTDMDYLQMEQAGDMLTLFFFQLQRNIENPIFHFRNIVGKIAYIASLFLKLGYLVGICVAFGLIVDTVSRRWFGHEIDWAPILDRATTFGWVQLALIAIVLIVIRRIVIRLNMPDTRLNSDTMSSLPQTAFQAISWTDFRRAPSMQVLKGFGPFCCQTLHACVDHHDLYYRKVSKMLRCFGCDGHHGIGQPPWDRCNLVSGTSSRRAGSSEGMV